MTTHDPSALGGPLQDMADTIRNFARAMSSLPAGVDDEPTPIYDAVQRDLEDTPRPAVKVALLVGGLLALLIIVLLVLAGLGWDAL